MGDFPTFPFRCRFRSESTVLRLAFSKNRTAPICQLAIQRSRYRRVLTSQPLSRPDDALALAVLDQVILVRERGGEAFWLLTRSAERKTVSTFFWKFVPEFSGHLPDHLVMICGAVIKSRDQVP